MAAVSSGGLPSDIISSVAQSPSAPVEDTTSTSTSVEQSTSTTSSAEGVTSNTSTSDTSTTSSAGGSTSEPSNAPTGGGSSGASAQPTGAASSRASAGASASGGVASSAAPTSAQRSQVVTTSYVVTTITRADGTIETSSAPIAITSSVTVGSGGGGGSNTGAIAGGVVGGVVGLALILGLVWWLLRRKRSHREDFDDNMFDPHRPQNHAAVDLADNGPSTVEPFYTPGVASTAQSPEMSQYPRSAATTSDGGYGAQNLSRGPSTATSAGFAGQGAFGSMAMPEPHLAGAGAAAGGAAAGGALAGMSAKQREAYQERQQNRVGGPAYGGYPAGGSGSGSATSPPMSPGGTSSGAPVTVAEDGGAYEDANALSGDQVPPTYDSIRR